jgi:cytoskeleton protein RodZ
MQATFGQQIRARREQMGLTPQDVAHRTRIPVEWIGRLEREDFFSFGSLAYTRGFLRSYSRFLGVDSSLVELELKCAAAAVQRSSGLNHDRYVKRTRPARRRTPVAAMMALTLFVVGTGLGVQTLAEKAQQREIPASKRNPIVQTEGLPGEGARDGGAARSVNARRG